MDLTREGPGVAGHGADWEMLWQGHRPRGRPFQPAACGHPPWRRQHGHGSPGTAGTREMRRACRAEEQLQEACGGGNGLRPAPPSPRRLCAWGPCPAWACPLSHPLPLGSHVATADMFAPGPRPRAQHEPCGACLCVSGRMVRGACEHPPRMRCAGFPGGLERRLCPQRGCWAAGKWVLGLRAEVPPFSKVYGRTLSLPLLVILTGPRSPLHPCSMHVFISSVNTHPLHHLSVHKRVFCGAFVSSRRVLLTSAGEMGDGCPGEECRLCGQTA